MNRKNKLTIIITLSVVYFVICALSGIIITKFHNYGLGFSFFDRERAEKFGLSTYDVKIEPGTIEANNDSLVFQDVWLQIDYYYRYIMPLVPFNTKYAIKIKSDWKAVHLCFQISENGGELSKCYLIISGEYCYTDARYPRISIGEGQLKWCYISSVEKNEIHGYLTKDGHDLNMLVPDSEFSIHIPWDKIRQKWDFDKFLWYPGCDE